MRAPRDVDYQLRVAAEEIEAMRGEIRLGNLPHIKAFLQKPWTRWMLTRLQELIWTFERLTPRRDERSIASAATIDKCLDATVPDVWFDVTNSYRSGFKGGVARVAMKLAQSATRRGHALPVVMKDGEIFAYADIEEGGVPLNVTPGTIFVIVDTFWKPFEEYRSMIERVRALGGRSVLCVHDVIALDYPMFFDIAFARDFGVRLATLLRNVDACVAVSGYTLRELRQHFADQAVLPMGSFRLGADFAEAIDGGAAGIRPALHKIFNGTDVFISVGTLEPRKGYAVSLDAFDDLWAENIECSFVIFGQSGWICNALEQRIREHPAYDKRLFWITDASDAELGFAYRAAYCLIQASIVEGFGLPIIEANREGTPVIASDAEIFREVGQNKLVTFKPCDGGDLARAIRDVLQSRPICEPLDVATWDQSLDELVATVRRLLPTRDSQFATTRS